MTSIPIRLIAGLHPADDEYAALTTDDAASSYGIPVLRYRDHAYGPDDRLPAPYADQTARELVDAWWTEQANGAERTDEAEALVVTFIHESEVRR
jgi:hypothetical protein